MQKICFVLDHPLKPYRIPFFNGLAEKGYKITVCYPGFDLHSAEPVEEKRTQAGKFRFQTIKLNNRKILNVHYFGVKNLARFDSVIFMQNMRIIDLWLATLHPLKSYKIIHWGIGTSSSKGLNLEYDLTSKTRNTLSLSASALVLYSGAVKHLFSSRVQKKLFIAHNTVHNTASRDFSGEKKDLFLFIGTLNRRKGLKLLFDSFHDYLDTGEDLRINKLVVIGSGEMFDELLEYRETLGLEKNIEFTGQLNDPGKKEKYFQRAAAAISPGQAGLSVLESFSYGVPFITFKEAITGGEIYNILNGKNGYLVNNKKQLVQKLYELQDENNGLAETLGRNAFEFYHKYRTMDKMIEQFEKAIEYTGNDSE